MGVRNVIQRVFSMLLAALIIVTGVELHGVSNHEAFADGGKKYQLIVGKFTYWQQANGDYLDKKSLTANLNSLSSKKMGDRKKKQTNWELNRVLLNFTR